MAQVRFTPSMCACGSKCERLRYQSEGGTHEHEPLRGPNARLMNFNCPRSRNSVDGTDIGSDKREHFQGLGTSSPFLHL